MFGRAVFIDFSAHWLTANIRSAGFFSAFTAECVSLQVEKIRQVKAKSLYLQVEKLHQSLTKLDSTIAAVSQVLDEGRHLDLLLARERMLTQIHELKTLRGLLQPQEDDRFMFTPPDQVSALVDAHAQRCGIFAP